MRSSYLGPSMSAEVLYVLSPGAVAICLGYLQVSEAVPQKRSMGFSTLQLTFRYPSDKTPIESLERKVIMGVGA